MSLVIDTYTKRVLYPLNAPKNKRGEIKRKEISIFISNYVNILPNARIYTAESINTAASTVNLQNGFYIVKKHRNKRESTYTFNYKHLHFVAHGESNSTDRDKGWKENLRFVLLSPGRISNFYSDFNIIPPGKQRLTFLNKLQINRRARINR